MDCRLTHLALGALIAMSVGACEFYSTGGRGHAEEFASGSGAQAQVEHPQKSSLKAADEAPDVDAAIVVPPTASAQEQGEVAQESASADASTADGGRRDAGEEGGAATPSSLSEVRLLLRQGLRARAKEALKRSVESYTEPAEERAARYLLGRLLTEDGEQGGLEHLMKLPTPFEAFEDRRLVWLARAHLLSGQDAPALAAIDTLIAEHGKIKELPALRLERARILHRQGKADEAILALKGVKGDRRLAAQALRQKIDWLSLDAEAGPLVDRLTRELLLTYPDEPAARRGGLPLDVEALTWGERHRRARTLMKRWHYAEAREEFRAMVAARQFVYDARWQIALISLRKIRDDPAEAREMLKHVRKIDGPHKEEATYLTVRSYMREERYDEALKVADLYEELYPEGEHIEVLQFYRAWLPFDHDDCKQAIPLFTAFVKDYESRRSLSLGFRAWCHVRMENWPQAWHAYGALLGFGNSIVRGKAHYWRAFIADKMGKREMGLRELAALHKLYPLTYYDILGQQLLARWEGRDPRASRLPWPAGGGEMHKAFPLDDAMWDWPQVKGVYVERYARVKRLVELGEVRRARRAWGPIRGVIERAVPSDKRLQFIHFMGHQVDDHKYGWQKVSGGRISAMTNLPDPTDARWLLAYPRAWAPLVERLSEVYELPSHFVYAVMRQESRYNPAAVSHTDAVGALQMIPQTARLVAADMGIEYDPRTFPRPEVSFDYSFFYMRKLADVFGGQLVLAAAAYNGGPTPIARWMRETPDVPLDRLIEEFAYNESRNYCRKVAEHTLRYLYLYEADPQVRGRWLDALFPTEVDYTLPEEIGY